MAGSEVEEVLGRLIAKLDRAGLKYMLVGSFASSMHGEPRSTQDIDLVVEPSQEALEALLKLLPEDQYYCDQETARRALRSRSMFNVIDMATIWKVDVIFQKADGHAQQAFSRRVKGQVGDTKLYVESAEDTIISKLRWAKRGGGSERQLRDVAGILSVAGETLDLPYLEKWVDALGLRELWFAAKG
jgi:hypothetical protein